MNKPKFVLCNNGTDCQHIHIQMDEGSPYDPEVRILSISDQDYAGLWDLLIANPDPRAAVQ